MEHMIRHIEQLDMGKGGGVISEKIKVEAIDNPILAIGLGGTGIDALLRLKHMINRRFSLPKAINSTKREEKPRNIEFLGIETNFAEKDKKYPDGLGVELNPSNELILLSNNGIAPMLAEKELLDDCIKGWLCPDLQPVNGTNGTRGIRQLGRLMLFAKMNEVIHSLKTKINALTLGTNEKLIVFILSGISGGTGGGCFIDIPYIIRGIFEERYGASAAWKLIMLGYIFMPDVNLSIPNANNFDTSYMIKNGFAALKELDYWMGNTNSKENFVQNYIGLLTVNTNMPPFNLCYLISAHNINGMEPDWAYDCCMNVTAENIINFITYDKQRTGRDYSLNDHIYYSRIVVEGALKPYKANYEYSILGAASVVLPDEYTVTYLGYRLFQTMKDMFHRAPSQKEIDDILKGLGLDRDSLSKRFDDGLIEPLRDFEQNPKIFNYNNVIRSDSAGVMESLTSYVQKSEERYLNISSELPYEIAMRFMEKAEELFVQWDKGPSFVSRLIEYNSGFDIIKQLEVIAESIENELKVMDRSIRMQEQMSLLKFDEAKNAFIISRERKKNDYIYARINEFKRKAYVIKLEEMKNFYNRLIPLIHEYYNSIYCVAADTLDRLYYIFRKNGEILTHSQEAYEQNSTTDYWNVISIPAVVKAIDSIFDKEKPDILINDFLTNFLKGIKQWVCEDKLEIVELISEFLSDKFGEIMSKSMEDFLIMRYGNDSNIVEIAANIFSDLNEKAEPMFYANDLFKTARLPSWRVAVLPERSPKIKEGVLKYQNTALNNYNFSIKGSNLNKITIFSNYAGVPLCCYSPIKLYEKAYKASINMPEHIGRHLVQNGEKDWTNLPSPIPEEMGEREE